MSLCRHRNKGGPCCLNALVSPVDWCEACTEAIRKLRGAPVPKLVQKPSDELYVRQLRAWDHYGTFDRIRDAAASGRDDIRIKRSSGEFVNGSIYMKGSGYGGLMTGIRFLGDDNTNRYKGVDTDKLIDWNPQLFGGLPEGYKGPRE